jgi:hypothetical protein
MLQVPRAAEVLGSVGLFCDIRAQVEQVTNPAQYPRARAVVSNVPIYTTQDLLQRTATLQGRGEVQAEIIHSLLRNSAL